MMLCMQKDTFIGTMGFALVRLGLPPSLKPFYFCCENGWILPREAPPWGYSKPKTKDVNWGEREQTLGSPRRSRGKGWTCAKEAKLKLNLQTNITET